MMEIPIVRKSAVFLFLIPIAAWADLNGTVTLNAGSAINLATGATGSSGDLLYSGTTFTAQGTAGALDAGNLQSFGFTEFGLANLQAYAPGLSTQPFKATQGDLLVVRTTGGYYSKILITAISSSSATLQFLTYGVTAAPVGPAITAIQNNYSYLQAGLPNYGIAPGTLFIIKGTDLASATTAVLQSTAGSGIPLQLNGASISVTVNGVTTHPGIYYAIATQIAAVLPSSTPVGTGTITVTYNNVTSSQEPIQVVPTALGFDTYFGSGAGLSVATDPFTGVPFYYNNSAQPGQTIVLWGSGLGADLADSDTAFTSPPHAVNTPLVIYIGGLQAVIGYQGGSGYPGVNQINVTIPKSVSTGCGISIVAVSGSMVSNTVSIPVMPGGGACSDPVVDGSTVFPSGASYNFGSLQIGQSVGSGQTSDGAGGSFINSSGPEATNGGGLTSLGNCYENQSIIGASQVSGVTNIALDPGTITVTGPSGTQPVPATAPPPPGSFAATLPAGFIPPATGGTFTFTGTGGKDVGPFTASISYTNPVSWSNMTAITTVSRSQGVTLNWTGGDPHSYILISGGSSSPQTPQYPVLGAGFFCYAATSAGSFTIPSSVLLAMPIGQGSLTLQNATTPQPFTASGLTYGDIAASFSFSIIVPYQ